MNGRPFFNFFQIKCRNDKQLGRALVLEGNTSAGKKEKEEISTWITCKPRLRMHHIGFHQKDQLYYNKGSFGTENDFLCNVK